MSWDTVWSTTGRIVSDYSIKYLDFMAEIKKRVPPGSNVLEAGCGTGQTLALFREKYRTYGLDKSPKSIEIAKNNCDFAIQGDILHMDMFTDDHFSMVYNSGVIEHFDHSQALVAIKEMARVSKPSGLIIVIVPNTACLWYRLWKLFQNNDIFREEGDYTIGKLYGLCQEAGINIEEIFGLQALPPLTTENCELLPESWRRNVGLIEQCFPAKHLYAYAIGIIGRKRACL